MGRGLRTGKVLAAFNPRGPDLRCSLLSVSFGSLRVSFGSLRSFRAHLSHRARLPGRLLMSGAGGGPSGPHACASGLPAASVGPSDIVRMSNALSASQILPACHWLLDAKDAALRHFMDVRSPDELGVSSEHG